MESHENRMTKQPSRSDQLIAAMPHAALTALAVAPGGQLQKSALMQAVESKLVYQKYVDKEVNGKREMTTPKQRRPLLAA